MLDIKFIRNNPNLVKQGCKKKQIEVDIDLLLEVDRKKRGALRALEDMLAQKNKASSDIVKAKEKKEKDKIILRMRELDTNSDRLNKTQKELEGEFNTLISQVPNIPFEDVPIGKDDRENITIREEGEKPKFDFEPKDYLEISRKYDLIDTERAAKTSGSRFGFLKREAAFLEFALINFAFRHLTQKGFIPVIPPVMLKPEMAKGTGYFEATAVDEAYCLAKDNLFLIGTSEQSLVAMHANEILNENDLPIRYMGFSTCFRREAGAYGKDTKGILRVHQFDKVEMFTLAKPEESRQEHRFFLEQEESLMRALKLPYRVINICTGDLGFPAAAKYDIEAWLPSEGKYRETHSTSDCTDFQARRLNIRYRDKNRSLHFVHTVNGTAFAVGRILIAIIENYQQKDGSVLVPEVLQEYLNFKKIG